MEHSAAPYGYRNRAQWAVRSGMPRALGYFLPESTVIVPIDECPVLSPRLARTFAKLQDMARSGTLPAGIQEIEAFADSADQKIALNVAFEKFSKSAAELASAFRTMRSRQLDRTRLCFAFCSRQKMAAKSRSIDSAGAGHGAAIAAERRRTFGSASCLRTNSGA